MCFDIKFLCKHIIQKSKIPDNSLFKYHLVRNTVALSNTYIKFANYLPTYNGKEFTNN